MDAADLEGLGVLLIILVAIVAARIDYLHNPDGWR